MRIEGRYMPKKWFRRRMFWVAVYPFKFLRNIALLHRHSVEDVNRDLFEWDFDCNRRDRLREMVGK